MRIGIGYDIHRLVSDRALRLGGVEIEYAFGLLGHSDGDVVLHAICDALLGASGLGDIGELFPDTDPAYKDADSRDLVAVVMKRVSDAGFEPLNVDVIIHLERPKLSAHKSQIGASIADLLGLEIDAVNVKATTNEGLDAVGRGEAIACWAACTLRDE